MEDKKDITKEMVSSYRKVAKQWNISENEPLIILSIRGQIIEPCSMGCNGCTNYDECFPQIPEHQKRDWVRLVNLVIGGI